MRPSWNVTRRSFLARLSAWAAACATLPSLRPQAAAGSGPPSPGHGHGIGTVAATNTDQVTLDRTDAGLFEHNLHSAFRIIPDPRVASPRTVVLAEVTRFETKTVTGRLAPSSTPAFSLIFREAQGRALPQDTYQVEHPQIGTFALFLVPIGPKQVDVVYQAVFA